MVPASTPGPIGRAAAAMIGAVSRLLGVGLPVTASSGGGIPVQAHYDVDASHRAMETNAWYWAGIHRISNDLAGLPLVIETGTGKNRVQSSEHWLLTLFESPHPKVSGRRFRKQLVADLKGGNSYTRVWRNPDGQPVQLGRIVPQVINPIVGLDGEELGWRITGRPDLGWRDVLHISDLNLAGDASLVVGSSPTQPLGLSLQVDRDVKRQAGRAAKRGRIEMMASPRSDSMMLGPDRTKGITRSYAEATENGHGIFVPSIGMEVTPLSLTARDMEFAAMSDRTRSEILAVLAVPESLVGTPAANYGTAREQSRIYWSTLQGIAALIDDEWSRLAEEGVRIRHSFAAVDALQPSRSERLARVQQLAALGMDVNDALRYEGFFDAPRVVAPGQAAQAAAPANSVRVQEPRKSEAVVTATLQVVAGLFDAGEDPDEIARSARWLLRSTLVGLGAASEPADIVATEAAAVCAETARAVQDGNLIELKAFGSEHARRITRLALVEAA